MNEFTQTETIQKKVLEIAELAKRSIRLSVEAFMNRHAGVCEEVKKIEKETDFLNVECEDKCLEILSSQNLPPKSFRFVASVMGISSRFERIADLATEICEYSIRGLPKPLPEPAQTIQEMERIFEEMVEIDVSSLSANMFVSLEDLKTKKDNMTGLYQKIHDDFIAYVHKHPESFDDAILIIKIASALERAGVLTSKIANRIVYVAEGRRIWL